MDLPEDFFDNGVVPPKQVLSRYFKPSNVVVNLLGLALIDVFIQFTGFCISFLLQTDKLYDITGTITFLILLFISWARNPFPSSVQSTQSLLIVAWAVRLGSHLFIRVLKHGKDRRFDAIRNDVLKYLAVWMMQAMWVFITLLPSLFVNMGGDRASEPEVIQYCGWALFCFGFVFEAIADYQKAVFSADESNRYQFINSGLWSISRHPNYFGEIICWIGLYISSIPSLRQWEHIAVLSPLFVIGLLTRVSGIPILEKNAKKRWGHFNAYKTYVKETALLVPFIY